MSYKVINEFANKEQNYCMVTIQTKEGKFSGYSICSPEDTFSTFAGIRYAEKRAVAAWCKHKARTAKIQLQTIDNLIKDLQYQDLPVPRYIKLKVRDYSNDIEYWTKAIKTLEDSVTKEDKTREDIWLRYILTE